METETLTFEDKKDLFWLSGEGSIFRNIPIEDILKDRLKYGFLPIDDDDDVRTIVTEECGFDALFEKTQIRSSLWRLSFAMDTAI